MILAVAGWWLELFSFDSGINIHFIRPFPFVLPHRHNFCYLGSTWIMEYMIKYSVVLHPSHIRKRGTGFAVKPRRWCLYQLMSTAHATFFQHVLNNITIKNQEFCQSLTKQGEICKTFLPISAQS